jgi:hypothetical protein
MTDHPAPPSAAQSGRPGESRSGAAPAPERQPRDAAGSPHGRSVPGDVPDLRRDAIEEAAETSPEALGRVADLNAREAAADPAFARPESRPR